jgi:lipoyl synthase
LGTVRKKKPAWFKININYNETYYKTRNLIKNQTLETVCENARCPNMGECFGRKTATFMILGNQCTRNCRFCAVEHNAPTSPDPQTATLIADSVIKLGLKYVVITSVTRDDLPDGGSSIFAEVIKRLREEIPQCKVEVLIPDFQGDRKALATVFRAEPDVLNHNMETIARLYPTVRPKAVYQRSLDVVYQAKQAGLRTKSGVMVGLGETKEELVALMQDLRQVDCDILTIGQYLKPKQGKLEVHRYWELEEFEELKAIGEDLGFSFVAAGPLVRSSYMADQAYEGKHT